MIKLLLFFIQLTFKAIFGKDYSEKKRFADLDYDPFQLLKNLLILGLIGLVIIQNNIITELKNKDPVVLEVINHNSKKSGAVKEDKDDNDDA